MISERKIASDSPEFIYRYFSAAYSRDDSLSTTIL